MKRVSMMNTWPLATVVAAALVAPASPTARDIAADTYFVPGAVPEDRGPDGNTVILVAPAGLIAIDTGRHPRHTDAILAFARDRRRPVAAIVNTHWHLDHSSGNRRVKAAHPQAKLYATRAVDRALAPGGMLARNLAAARARQPDPNASAIRREETALFIATMEAADALRPDVVVSESGKRSIAGRLLSVRVAVDAVTDADLWLYDEATRVAIIGDLVTLPAPFFETACPARWQQALDDVWATPFRLAVPGHGAPMTRDQFDTYRRAFAGFRACVGSDSPAAVCAAGWTRDVSALMASDADRREASEYATYYVDFLRKNGGASPDCRVK
jgi:glyoxylase-like metal-dependent hydrolase (beta-lactamase superfamily II)